MEIVFKKRNTKNTLTCNRSDGTSTWMELDSFMVMHDLTHFVVESVLKATGGFYGLLTQGLDITVFERKQKITPSAIPIEGIRMEILVGLLLTERSDNQFLPDFNKVYHELCMTFGFCGESIDEATLSQFRSKIDDILKKWKNLPVGNSLVFNFPPS